MLPSPMRALGRRVKENSPDELHLAVLTGRSKKIKHLLKKGVHIESVNSSGETPLYCAAYGGDFEISELLLRLGANPNRRCGSDGASPIHAASYRGSRRVLRLLVEAGGDLSLRDLNLVSPREYAEKQPSPLRRQKVLEFFDLLFAMTLHRATTSTLPLPSMVSHSEAGTLTRSNRLKGFFGGSQLSLARKHSQSSANLFSSCATVSDVSSLPSSDETDSSKMQETVPTENLHKNVSCHLLDQLCVTTSLPLLSPDQLIRPAVPFPAYTCGGPTVYSSFSWLGTSVTVRRPTPALALTKHGDVKEGGGPGAPDEEAVQSILQELSFLRRLRHPGFLEVMAACHVTQSFPDHVTLVYQNVAHGSLYHHLHVKHRDLSVGAAVDILVGLVEALLFMHAHGWFHCGLSSHCVHLVNLGGAKLGGFEYALERQQVKGNVGMRAEHISKASWLIPWQAPETIVEKMFSVKSEVYCVSAIIWEIWSGMAPWAGVEDEVVSKRITAGECLPALTGSPQSLVSYLTQYGLKWNSHERELDLQEVHTMLRSLRIQCDEEERVPAVTSWGPPSIPNTPIVGRHSEPRETPRHYNENLGIKPASHQLTRHSSSCSLASGPPSPAHSQPVSEYSPQRSLPTSPTKSKTMPVNSRPLSVFSDRDFVLRQATLPSKSRKYSATPRRRAKKKMVDLEIEEEFIDDEFNNMLYDAPHMQLSVGSSENLLDSRLSFTLVEDSMSSSSGASVVSRSSSEDLSAPEKIPEVERNSKDSEPLKSVQLLRNMQKNFSSYLPTHYICSDSD